MVNSLSRTALVAMCASLTLLVASTSGAGAATASVGLGSAGSFAVLAGTTVTNTGASTVHGSLGVSPGTAVTGFPPGVVSNGAIHAADAEAAAAEADLTIAFNDAAGRASTATVTADLAGQTLIPGVYTGGTLALGGDLTLDGQGDPNAVFIFRAASTLVTASASKVTLINGAAACRVFWQVGSSATIGTSSNFAGTVLALTSIAAQTNATIDGRLLARNGAVTLDSNTFTGPSCASAAATTGATGTNATGVTIPGTGGPHTFLKLKGGLAAVLLGAGLVFAGRRARRGNVAPVTAGVPISK